MKKVRKNLNLKQDKKNDLSNPILMVGAIQRVGPNFMDIKRRV
jgi:hypothetical protein